MNDLIWMYEVLPDSFEKQIVKGPLYEDQEHQIGLWIDLDDGNRAEFTHDRNAESVETLIEVLKDYAKGLKEDAPSKT